MRRLTSRRVRCDRSWDIAPHSSGGARRSAGGALAPQRRHAPAVCSASATSSARRPRRSSSSAHAPTSTSAARRDGGGPAGWTRSASSGRCGLAATRRIQAPPASTETRYVERREHRGPRASTSCLPSPPNWATPPTTNCAPCSRSTRRCAQATGSLLDRDRRRATTLSKNHPGSRMHGWGQSGNRRRCDAGRGFRARDPARKVVCSGRCA